MNHVNTKIMGLLVLACFGLGCVEESALEDPDQGIGWDQAVADQLGPAVDRPTPVTVTGKVVAPNGKMPISGALVYATGVMPKPIPDGVYCDKCVELPKITPNARSKADGTFSLELPYKGKWIIVVQKGAFRRAREVTVPAGSYGIPVGLTTLPGKRDAAKNDFIPKMAVLDGAWDDIERSLAKLGLGQVNAKGGLVKDSQSFAYYKCEVISLIPPKQKCTPAAPSKLLTDYDEMKKYNIIFVPCDSDWLDGYFTYKKVKENLLKWIKAGGRLYVTDYQYDLLHLILPNFIKWVGQSGTLGSAELTSSYDAPAIVQEKDLKAWLAAQGITSFTLEDSFTIVDSVTKLKAPGPDQKPHDVLPKAWILAQTPSNGIKPATVSYPYGCGRILFSTYHTEGKKSTGAKLLPQERALLYIILEVAVCLKNPEVG